MAAYGQSYWTRRETTPRKSRATLKGAVTTDVVVIGGGLTGCATAFVLAKAGLKVILLEQHTIASGATSRGMGLVLPTLDVSFGQAMKEAGARPAKVTAAELRRSAREFAATLAKLKIKADVTAADLLVNAPFTNDAALLKKDVAQRKAARLDGAWLNAAQARDALATETQGAMRVRDAWGCDPVKAARGLAAAASAAGARLIEGAVVKKTTFTRKTVTVVLQGATVTARGVVVATGEPGRVFHQLQRHVRVSRGYVVASEPLTRAMRSAVGAREAIYTEATDSPRWLRWLPDGRAVFGGLSGPAPAAALQDKAVLQRTNQLMYELSLRYPDISGLPPAFGWDMPVVTTADGLPWIGPHRNYPFHFFAMAFGWHGEAFAWMAAQAAGRYFTGKATKDDALLGFARAL
jgi:glycine/D-amino acid oxidase-like deaminating enzyme